MGTEAAIGCGGDVHNNEKKKDKSTAACERKPRDAQHNINMFSRGTLLCTPLPPPPHVSFVQLWTHILLSQRNARWRGLLKHDTPREKGVQQTTTASQQAATTSDGEDPFRAKRVKPTFRRMPSCSTKNHRAPAEGKHKKKKSGVNQLAALPL